ncbi:DUF3784 domain-containing protein [Paenimyroides ceti]
MTAVVILAIIFVVLGTILTTKNADSLLSGYNTMSDEKRRNIEIEQLIPFLNRSFKTIGLIILITGTFAYFIKNEKLYISALALFPIISAIIILLYSKKYNKNIPTRFEKVMSIMVLIILMTIAFFIVFQVFIQEDYGNLHF